MTACADEEGVAHNDACTKKTESCSFWELKSESGDSIWKAACIESNYCGRTMTYDNREGIVFTCPEGPKLAVKLGASFVAALTISSMILFCIMNRLKTSLFYCKSINIMICLII